MHFVLFIVPPLSSVRMFISTSLQPLACAVFRFRTMVFAATATAALSATAVDFLVMDTSQKNKIEEE
jgi:hypothetical protein